MLNQDNIVPLYEQLMNILERDIRTGKYSPGDRIMTESELSKKYGISLITVRKAISLLTEKGLLIKKQGKGTFVAKPKYSRNIRRLSGFPQMCEQLGVVPGGRMLDNRLIAADEKTAKKLGVAPGSDIIYIHRLRYADGQRLVEPDEHIDLRMLLQQLFRGLLCLLRVGRHVHHIDALYVRIPAQRLAQSVLPLLTVLRLDEAVYNAEHDIPFLRVHRGLAGHAPGRHIVRPDPDGHTV